MKISLIEDKKGWDSYFILEIPEINLIQKTDLYYYAIDTGFKINDESIHKAKVNFKNLIDLWVRKLNKQCINQIIFLPFDFSDQYLGCLRIEQKENNKCLVNYGYTVKFQGYSFYPSNSSNFEITDREFKPMGTCAVIIKDVILEGIEKSIKKI